MCDFRGKYANPPKIKAFALAKLKFFDDLCRNDEIIYV